MKTIAIIVQNIIQWYSVRPIVKYLLDKKNSVDIFVYDPDQNNLDFHNIGLDTVNIINQEGYKVKEWPKNQHYHLCLAPYSDMINFPCKYRLAYCYGAAATKPSTTLQPEHKMGFHGFLLHDIYTAELLSVYGKTYLVPDLYLQPFKHKKTQNKPVILYLPTYNEPDVPAVANALSALKNDYYIITKGHHGIDHLKNEAQKKDILVDVSDENYSSSQYIQPLFEKADIVLSDNSGAAMDALYSKIPVVIATSKISPDLNGIEPIQQKLITSDVIPYVKNINPENLKSAFNQALTRETITAQSSMSDKLFPAKNGGAKLWFQVIQKYLNEEIDQNYCKLHDYYINKWQELKQDNTLLNKELQNTQRQLELYKKSRAHQTLEKILSSRHQKQNPSI